jgi:rhodanese-related sulfurtransferase
MNEREVNSGGMRRGLIWGIIALAVALPVVWYCLVILASPGIGAAAAHSLAEEGNAVLVNIGIAPELAAHFGSVTKWPLSAILEAKSTNDIPSALRGEKLLLLCTGGIRSAAAAKHLKGIGVDALSVRGGAQQYVCAAPGCSQAVLLRGSPEEDAAIPAFRASPLHEQFAVVGAFFGIKAIYSVLSLWMAWMLWKRKEADLSAIRWAMIFFFSGEACCFVNVMVFFEDSVLLEHAHSIGMVLSMGFFTYGLLEGLDARVIHFSGEGRCAMLGLCRGCVKLGETACALRKLFLFMIPATALVAAMPLCSEFRNIAYNTRVLGVLHSYRHPVIHQLYEIRYLPVLAIVLLAICFLVLWLLERRSVAYSKILFAAAMGAMGFSLLRLFIVAPYIENQVWFAFWEETTELVYIGAVGAALLVFKRGLLGKPSKETADA